MHFSDHSKSFVASGVALAHMLAIAWMVVLTAPKGADRLGHSYALPIEAHVYVVQQALDTVPIPEVQLHRVSLDVDNIQMVKFEDPDAGDISHVIASTSGPQLSRFQIADVSAYARRAGLSVGRPVTTVLVVEVLPDGSVGTVSVSRGSGNPAADAAAMDYARMRRWTPGTVDHRAQGMRIRFSVTLAAQANGT